jgi:hypothetical protein
MDEGHRWRVTVKAVYLPQAGEDQMHVVTEEALHRIVGRQPDAAPSYDWHPGGEVTVAVEVRAENEPSALYQGAALILEALPPPPRTTVVKFGARRVAWEPADFFGGRGRRPDAGT